MRIAWIVLALAACGPKVSPQPARIDEDLGAHDQPATTDEAPEAAARPVAPAGKGARTGTIARDRLEAVLAQGLPLFLRQFEVAPKKRGERFVGWQVVQIDPNSSLAEVDVAPGDVLLSINGKPLSRPEELMAVWDALRGENAIEAKLWRGDAQLILRFQIEPQVAPSAPKP